MVGQKCSTRYLAVLLSVLFLGAAPAAGAPEPKKTQLVSWTPHRIHSVVSPTRSQTINVSLQSSIEMNNISLVVDGSVLGPFVTISPNSFQHLDANSVTTIAVTFAIPVTTPTNAPRRLAGKIKIKPGGNRREADMNGDDEERMPPLRFTFTRSDDVALVGKDADGNGIRDDIDQYIKQTYTKPEEKAAAVQIASALQKTLIEAYDKELSYRNAARIGDAIHCIHVFEDRATQEKILELKALTLDTEIRTNAWLAFNAQIAGGYFKGIVGGDNSKACVR